MPNHPNRRDFVRLAAAAAAVAAAPALPGQTSQRATVGIGRKPVASVPQDFTGLSYESPQLGNPSFFSAENVGLIKLFRDLAPYGVLRTGGNLSAFTAWHDSAATPPTPTEQVFLDRGKKYWEWDLTDPSVRHGKREAIFTPDSIQTLAAFLKATGWKLIYGLNFATGTPEQAAAEAACVQRLIGKDLVAFQLGNELDFWVGGFRPKDWNFSSYYKQWSEWVRIIRARVPNAPFGGPDVAIRLDWMEQLAEQMGTSIGLLSKHHYAMGPAGDPRMNAEHLLGPDPDVAKEIASAQRAKVFAGVGFRNTECNSCFHGGQPGVSDAYASALWCADYMLTLMQGGHLGVNLHGGGDGFYSPIVGDAGRGFTARPLYFGMQFAQSFAGTQMLECSLSSGANVTAYAAKTTQGRLLALINKGVATTTFEISATGLDHRKPEDVWRLSAPALDSKTGVRFAPDLNPTYSAAKNGAMNFTVAPYTAVLVRLS